MRHVPARPCLRCPAHGRVGAAFGSAVARWLGRAGVSGSTTRRGSGSILHQIGYQQAGAVRPIIYRLSLSEIWVPYAEPDFELGLACSLRRGRVRPGTVRGAAAGRRGRAPGATFLDEVVGYDTSADGTFKLPHATAIYERMTPTLWSRVDPSSLEREGRGGRELVVTAEYAIGSYDYGIDYVFGQDGAITVEARATGTLLNKGVKGAAEADGHGTHVAPFVGAPDHQHFINFRIDFDVDGPANRVVEEDTMHDPESEPNAFIIRRHVLSSEGGRDADTTANRSWRIESTDHTNALGSPTAYRIVPTDWTIPFSDARYVSDHGARFAAHQLWATGYAPGELYAAGQYPIGDVPGGGVDQYATPPDSVDGTDLVVWYTLGLTHHPEVEEYPVMNSHRMSFRITPSGFFDRNPALDLPER